MNIKIIHISDFHLSNPSWRDLSVVLAGLGVGAGLGSRKSLLEVLNSRDWSKLVKGAGLASLAGLIVLAILEFRHYQWTKAPLALALLVQEIEEKFPDAWVIITGDLTDKGEPEEYELARILLDPLIRQNRVIAVPGNHDDPLLPNPLNRGVEHFKKHFKTCRGVPVGEFPFIREIGGGCVVIGLNSAHNVRRPSGTGSIGKEQLERLDKLLSSSKLKSKVKILALHHDPFNLNPFTELKDADELFEVIENRVDIVLFGHKHHSRLIRSRYGTKLICSAPSSVVPDEKGLLLYRMIEISGKNEFKVHPQSLNFEKSIQDIQTRFKNKIIHSVIL